MIFRRRGGQHPSRVPSRYTRDSLPPSVHLSAFSVVDDVPEEEPPRRRYEEIRHLAEAAETAGLRTLWIAEHHFHPGGLCPSPPVLLAWVGARTERLRLGVMVSVLPFHAPIDLAEQYALLDQLVGGRLSLGVGSGYIPMEFDGFGVRTEEKRERFESHLATLLAAFRGEEVQGEAPGAKPVRINVRPHQRPQPPLWIAVQRREPIPFLARAGRSIALVPYASVSGLAELAEEIREYRENLPAGSDGRVAAAVHLYAGSRPELARSCLARYLETRRATQSTNYLARVAEDPRRADPSTLEEAGFALFGTAESVRRRLGEYERAGVDEILGIFDFGGLPLAEVVGSVRSLGAAWVPPRAP
ncbi:MAG: LLM class flavin-dependent oxidoreductase [Thermoplasmata archaeon]